jgi:chemotaxis protein MotB
MLSSTVVTISGPLEKVENSIRVEGHTCDLPIQSGQYPSNWELSTARAAAVVRYLIEDAGISPDRLSASGYADSKPLAPNTCESNRAINRRVDIIIQKTGQSTGER